MEYVILSVQWDWTYRLKDYYAIRMNADFHKVGEISCDPEMTGTVDIPK